jgi:hypothetical protein
MKTYQFQVIAGSGGAIPNVVLDPNINGILVDIEVVFGSPAPNSLTIQLASPSGTARTLASAITSTQFAGLTNPLAMPSTSYMFFSGNSTAYAVATIFVYFI